jgi:hypothetical protein
VTNATTLPFNVPDNAHLSEPITYSERARSMTLRHTTDGTTDGNGPSAPEPDEGPEQVLLAEIHLWERHATAGLLGGNSASKTSGWINPKRRAACS